MLVHVPDHFSSKLRFNLKKMPVIVTDRSSLAGGTAGCFFGSFMLWLGLFELFSFFKAEQIDGQSLIMVELFAVIVILLALSIIIYSVFAFIRYKKFFFDGENFEMIYRPAIGVRHHFREPLANYIGVRLRVLFTQSGLFNKTRYIIDLYHKDINKIVPLYISTKNKDVREIWESYARIFGLPALSISDRGLVKRDCADLDKSVKELFEEGKLPFITGGQMPAPQTFEVTEHKTSTTIYPKGIYFDTLSALFLFMTVTAFFMLLAGGVYLIITGTHFPAVYWICGVFLLFSLLYGGANLFAVQEINVSAKQINLYRRLLGMTLKSEVISGNTIESVELSYNPAVERYFLSIISDKKIMTFGDKLPVSDLLWLRDYLIRKLIGN